MNQVLAMDLVFTRHDERVDFYLDGLGEECLLI